ncbi:O-antigen ligase family protein [Alienimonas californiensis]|uniref:O-antigen ligase family protein n=1 Tax=Alienimonas californiensis TaxID=2527989 RepID=UPI0013FCF494
MIGFLVGGLRGNQIKGVSLFACCSLVAYLGLSYISYFMSVNPRDSAWFLSFMWKIVLMAVVGVALLDRPGRLTALVWVFVLAQGYNALRINEDYFRTGIAWYALRGWAYQDNNIYSMLTMPAAGCSLGLMVGGTRTWQRLLAGGIFTLQMHEVMLLASRGAMLGGIAMGAFCFLLIPKTKYSLLAAAAVVTAAALLAGPSVTREFASSFESGEDLDSSADSRFKLWEAGWNITLDYPLLGVGPNAGRRLVPRYYAGGLDTTNKSLHNIIFDISTGSGVPATFAYYSFFIAPWLALLRIWIRGRQVLPSWARVSTLAYLCGLVGYFVSGMFATSPLIETPYGLGALGCAAVLVIRRHLRQLDSAADGIGGGKVDAGTVNDLPTAAA